jgi:hypothetical protein
MTEGGFAFGPKGVPHTFTGAGPDPTRLLVGFAPMQFGGFLREVGQPAPARVLPPTLGVRLPILSSSRGSRSATASSSSALPDRRSGASAVEPRARQLSNQRGKKQQPEDSDQPGGPGRLAVLGALRQGLLLGSGTPIRPWTPPGSRCSGA